MPISWPVTLPYKVKRDAYRIEQLGGGIVSSPMQAGRTRMRRTATLRVSVMPWAQILTAAQLDDFREFVADTLADGTARFTMPIWSSARLAYVDCTVSIRGGIAGVAEDELWLDRIRVTMVLEVEGLIGAPLTANGGILDFSQPANSGLLVVLGVI